MSNYRDSLADRIGYRVAVGIAIVAAGYFLAHLIVAFAAGRIGI